MLPFTELDGSILTEKDLLGKVLVLDFWSSNCASCISQIDEIHQLEKKYIDNPNVIFLAVNAAVPDTYQKFKSSRHVKLFSDSTTFVYDKEGVFAKAFDMVSFPKFYIINPKGEITNYINGYWDDEKLFTVRMKQEIDKLLK